MKILALAPLGKATQKCERTREGRPRPQEFDFDLMEINEDSFEPKSLMERPWNPEIQG